MYLFIIIDRYSRYIVDYELSSTLEKGFVMTGLMLSFLSMMEIYAAHWTIEVFFKEAKQQLKLGTCQSRDFDAQIAHVTACYLLYTLLVYFRRVNSYESLGGLFDAIKND